MSATELTWIAAARLGQETAEILERGTYLVDEREVNLEPLLRAAVDGTEEIAADAELSPPSAPRTDATEVVVENEPSLAAARRRQTEGRDPLVLNFASALEPGGRFLHGARAQEEYLARASGLFACLRDRAYYEIHRALGDPLYTDAAIYSPAVPVIRDDDGLALIAEPYGVSMLTYAAPRADRIVERAPERRPEIAAALERRIAKIFALGAAHGHDALVLGAWGCGAFGNDIAQVARLFHERIQASGGAFTTIDFAILDTSRSQRFIRPFEAEFKS